jgi:epidermal growth factor receptor substrate 15
MKSFYIFLAFLLSAYITQAQTDVEVYTTAKNYKTGKKESGVTVTVYDGASVYFTKTTGSNGQVDFKAPIGKTYKVVFSKPGMVTRFALINATKIDVEVIQGKPQVGFEVSLFEDIPNVDFSPVTNEPFAEFKSDGKNPELQFNPSDAAKHKKKIDDLIAAGEKSGKDADANYNNAIKMADALAQQKNYPAAIKKYEEALAIKPTEKYPSDQIIKLEALVQADKQKNLANEQDNAEYNNLIKAADALRDQKKYKEALAKYEDALKLKNERYAKDQISDMEDIIAKLEKEAANEEKYKAAISSGDGFMKQKSYKAAKDQYLAAQKLKPSEAYPKQKLDELEKLLNAEQEQLNKKKQYDEAITAADDLFSKQKWEEAKAKYQEALKLESAASYPAAKIKECDVKIAEIEKEKARLAQIEKLLAEGQTAFAANQLEPSKAKYQEVLKLDAENATAKAKIKEIDAKIDAEKANAEKNAAFAKLVTDGDNLAKASKPEEAISKYQEALKIKSDPSVDQKIADLNKIIAENKGKAEKKAQYDAAMTEGENLLKSNKLPEAKQKFELALSIDNTQQVPKDKIKEIDAKIDAENKNKQKKEQFDAAMQAGDALLSADKLQEAKAKYQEAQKLDESSPAPKAKIKEIDDKLAANQAAQQKIEQFNNLLKAGDDLFAAGKYAEAKVKYQDAGKLDASSAIPPQKIKQVDDALVNQADASKKERAKR